MKKRWVEPGPVFSVLFSYVPWKGQNINHAPICLGSSKDPRGLCGSTGLLGKKGNFCPSPIPVGSFVGGTEWGICLGEEQAGANSSLCLLKPVHLLTVFQAGGWQIRSLCGLCLLSLPLHLLCSDHNRATVSRSFLAISVLWHLFFSFLKATVHQREANSLNNSCLSDVKCLLSAFISGYSMLTLALAHKGFCFASMTSPNVYLWVEKLGLVHL